jgi:Leucine Rich repeat
MFYDCCIFGSQQDVEQLLAAFHTNRTIMDLTIVKIGYVNGWALGACLSALLLNMPNLQRLAFSVGDSFVHFGVYGFRALQPGLRVNTTLKELDLSYCYATNKGLRLLADALVGNTTMTVLDITANEIDTNGLTDIMRILASTCLKTLLGYDNRMEASRATEVLNFLKVLGNNTSIQELQISGLETEHHDFAMFVCARNKSLSHAELLLARLSLPQHQQQHHHLPPHHQPRTHGSTTISTCTTTTTSLMWMKLYHRAIAKFTEGEDVGGGDDVDVEGEDIGDEDDGSPEGEDVWGEDDGDMVPGHDNTAGSSAIFKLFQARPALLEKRLKRPPLTTVAIAVETDRCNF